MLHASENELLRLETEGLIIVPTELSIYKGRNYGMRIWNKQVKLRRFYFFPYYALPMDEGAIENETGKILAGSTVPS